MSQIKDGVLDSFVTQIIEASHRGMLTSRIANSIVDHNTGNITKANGDSHMNRVLDSIHKYENDYDCEGIVSKRDGLDMFERVGVAYADANHQIQHELGKNQGSRLVVRSMTAAIDFESTSDGGRIAFVDITMFANHYHKMNGKLRQITTKSFHYGFEMRYTDDGQSVAAIPVSIGMSLDE